MTVQRTSWLPWTIAALVSLGVGIAAYNAGMSHGLSLSSHVPVVSAPWGLLPWFHHAGLGFPFVFPLFFVLFWLVVARAFFWRGGWHRFDGPSSAADFDRWHRDAHDKMNRSNL